jgi:tripartite-type tricarboxylate transporter receptor subunit TctC
MFGRMAQRAAVGRHAFKRAFLNAAAVPAGSLMLSSVPGILADDRSVPHGQAVDLYIGMSPIPWSGCSMCFSPHTGSDRNKRSISAEMRKLGAIACAVAMAVAAGLAAARAQQFPDHPIKVVVAYPPGGVGDTVTRVATQGLGPLLGQSVIVENIAGAGGRLGTRSVARAAPDGYTLAAGGTNDNAVTPALYGKLDYDPVKDFAPVVALAIDSNALVINPAVPVNSIAELVTYAKEHPGKLTSGSTIGIAPHLLLEFLRARTGIDMLFVPYKGAAPAIADVLGNQIQVTVSAKSVLLPLIKAGKLRALAVTSAMRWPELPDVPTLHESGLFNFPTTIWFTLMAPAATPPAVIGKLNTAVQTRLQSTETKAAIAKLGLETRLFSPEQLAEVLNGEAKLWKAVAAEAKVHLD